MPKKLNERELIARRLNNLKKLICKVTDSLGYIENELAACGEQTDTWWYKFRKEQREMQEQLLLGRLAIAAEANSVAGNYSKRTEWIDTPEGKRWKANQQKLQPALAAMDAAIRAQVKTARAAEATAEIIRASLPERKPLDSSSRS
jgi:hypothetical protein